MYLPINGHLYYMTSFLKALKRASSLFTYNYRCLESNFVSGIKEAETSHLSQPGCTVQLYVTRMYSLYVLRTVTILINLSKQRLATQSAKLQVMPPPSSQKPCYRTLSFTHSVCVAFISVCPQSFTSGI